MSFRFQHGPQHLTDEEVQFGRAVLDRFWRRVQTDKAAPNSHPIYTRKALEKLFVDLDEYCREVNGHTATQVPKVGAGGKRISSSKMQRDRYMLLK